MCIILGCSRYSLCKVLRCLLAFCFHLRPQNELSQGTLLSQNKPRKGTPIPQGPGKSKRGISGMGGPEHVIHDSCPPESVHLGREGVPASLNFTLPLSVQIKLDRRCIEHIPAALDAEAMALISENIRDGTDGSVVLSRRCPWVCLYRNLGLPKMNDS